MIPANTDGQLEHEPEFFAAVADLSDHQLTNFSSMHLLF